MPAVACGLHRVVTIDAYLMKSLGRGVEEISLTIGKTIVRHLFGRCVGRGRYLGLYQLILSVALQCVVEVVASLCEGIPALLVFRRVEIHDERHHLFRSACVIRLSVFGVEQW